MSSTAARPERDDRPPSTPGTSSRRARRWPLRVGLLALGLLVVVSSRAKTTQEANQLGGAVILPLIFVAAAQTATLLLAPPLVVVAAGAVVWALAIGLVAFNARRFTRDRLASSS